jgi:hypothetical protein
LLQQKELEFYTVLTVVYVLYLQDYWLSIFYALSSVLTTTRRFGNWICLHPEMKKWGSIYFAGSDRKKCLKKLTPAELFEVCEILLEYLNTNISTNFNMILREGVFG